MRPLLLIVLVLSTACAVGVDDGYEGWPDYRLTPESLEGREGWSRAVEMAAAQWTAALEAEGCASPLEVGPGGAPIVLVPLEQWDMEIVGVAGHYRIEVSDRWWWAAESELAEVSQYVLVHEIGHALGLGHDEHPESVMGEANTRGYVRPYDAVRAAEVLGCR